MVEIMEGAPKVAKSRRGKKPLYDDEILAVLDQNGKYLHTSKIIERESIRRRAYVLGYRAKTSTAKGGGWNIEIFSPNTH